MVLWSLIEKITRSGAICFEIRIPRKKRKELLRKVPSKIYGSNFIMEKNKNIFGLSIIPNIITEKWGYKRPSSIRKGRGVKNRTKLLTDSILILFRFGLIPFWSYSILVLFHFSLISLHSGSILVLFHFVLIVFLPFDMDCCLSF